MKIEIKIIKFKIKKNLRNLKTNQFLLSLEGSGSGFCADFRNAFRPATDRKDSTLADKWDSNKFRVQVKAPRILKFPRLHFYVGIQSELSPEDTET